MVQNWVFENGNENLFCKLEMKGLDLERLCYEYYALIISYRDKWWIWNFVNSQFFNFWQSYDAIGVIPRLDSESTQKNDENHIL